MKNGLVGKSMGYSNKDLLFSRFVEYQDHCHSLVASVILVQVKCMLQAAPVLATSGHHWTNVQSKSLRWKSESQLQWTCRRQFHWSFVSIALFIFVSLAVKRKWNRDQECKWRFLQFGRMCKITLVSLLNCGHFFKKCCFKYNRNPAGIGI